MSNLIRLVQNENMKLYRKVSTIVMLFMLLVFIIGAGAITKFNHHPESSDHWQTNLQQQTQGLKSQLAHVSGQEAVHLKEQIALNDYQLHHNIPPLLHQSVWGFTNEATNIMMIVIVFTIIMAGGMVSSEFSSGTIKLLLTRPIRRSKILFSKYISVMAAGVLFSILGFIFSWLVGGIFFGFSDLSHPYLYYSGGAVHEGSMLGHIIANYGIQFIQLIIMVTIAFMISSVFRNTALATGLSIFAMMAGPLVIQLLAGYDWVKYILFTNLDLSYYFAGGTPLFDGMTLAFSITVLLIYYCIFMALTWLFFTKRDVAA